MEGVIDNGRWKEVNRMLEKMTQGDKELAERLSPTVIYNYLSNIMKFSNNLLTLSPEVDYEYKKSMQDIFLHYAALHKLGYIMNVHISDIVPVDNDFVPNEFNQFYVFEHKGKKYCINNIKEVLHKYEFEGIIMDPSDKEELNNVLNLLKNGPSVEAREVIKRGFRNFESIQYCDKLDTEFWNKLNSDEISFENKSLDQVLSMVKKGILPHLHIKVNGEDRFLNPNYNNIPMCKNINDILALMQILQRVLNRFNELGNQELNEGDLVNYQNLKSELQKYYLFFENQYLSYVSFNQMPTRKDVNTLMNKFVQSDYYKSLSKDEKFRILDLIYTIDEPNLKKMLVLTDPQKYPDGKQRQENLRKIMQMILVSDISVEMMYQEKKLGYISLNGSNGLIYQKPGSKDIEMVDSLGNQKININERLSGYLEDSTGQEYLKRMIYLRDNINISDIYLYYPNISPVLNIVLSSAHFNSLKDKKTKQNELEKIKEAIEKEEKEIEEEIKKLEKKRSSNNGALNEVEQDYYELLKNLLKEQPKETEKVSRLTRYRLRKNSLEVEETKEDFINEIINTENNIAVSISHAINYLTDRYNGVKLDIFNRLINPENYISTKERQELWRISDIINDSHNLLDVFYEQHKKYENELKNAKESLDKIGQTAILPSTRRRKKRKEQLLKQQVDDLTKKQENFDKLFNQTLNSLIDRKDLSKEKLIQISNILASNLNDVLDLNISKDREWELIQLVFKIAQNDPTGHLMNRVNEVLKLPAGDNYVRKVYMDDIYKISQLYNNGEFPSDISDLIESEVEYSADDSDKDRNTKLYAKYGGLHNQIKVLKPIPRVAGENSHNNQERVRSESSLEDNNNNNNFGNVENNLDKGSNYYSSSYYSGSSSYSNDSVNNKNGDSQVGDNSEDISNISLENDDSKNSDVEDQADYSSYHEEIDTLENSEKENNLSEQQEKIESEVFLEENYSSSNTVDSLSGSYKDNSKPAKKADGEKRILCKNDILNDILGVGVSNSDIYEQAKGYDENDSLNVTYGDFSSSSSLSPMKKVAQEQKNGVNRQLKKVEKRQRKIKNESNKTKKSKNK